MTVPPKRLVRPGIGLQPAAVLAAVAGAVPAGATTCAPGSCCGPGATWYRATICANPQCPAEGVVYVPTTFQCPPGGTPLAHGTVVLAGGFCYTVDTTVVYALCLGGGPPPGQQCLPPGAVTVTPTACAGGGCGDPICPPPAANGYYKVAPCSPCSSGPPLVVSCQAYWAAVAAGVVCPGPVMASYSCGAVDPSTLYAAIPPGYTLYTGPLEEVDCCSCCPFCTQSQVRVGAATYLSWLASGGVAMQGQPLGRCCCRTPATVPIGTVVVRYDGFLIYSGGGTGHYVGSVVRAPSGNLLSTMSINGSAPFNFSPGSGTGTCAPTLWLGQDWFGGAPNTVRNIFREAWLGPPPGVQWFPVASGQSSRVTQTCTVFTFDVWGNDLTGEWRLVGTVTLDPLAGDCTLGCPQGAGRPGGCAGCDERPINDGF